MYQMKNWSIRRGGPGWLAPELCHPSLQGNVFGNPKFPDNSFIHTSAIDKIDKNLERAIVHTRSGSQYIIHASDIDPDYEAAFPNAFARLSLTVE